MLVEGIVFPVGEGADPFAEIFEIEEIGGADADIPEGIFGAFDGFGDVEQGVEDVFLDRLILEQGGDEAFADPGFWGGDAGQVEQGGGDVGMRDKAGDALAAALGGLDDDGDVEQFGAQALAVVLGTAVWIEGFAVVGGKDDDVVFRFPGLFNFVQKRGPVMVRPV